jgi:hypothetical protein
LNSFRLAVIPALLISAITFIVCAVTQIILVQANHINSVPTAAYLFSAPLQVLGVFLWLTHRHRLSSVKSLGFSLGILAPLLLAGYIGLVAVYFHFGGRM